MRVLAITDAGYLELIHRAGELASSARSPDAVVDHVRQALVGLLDLESCRFEYGSLLGQPPRLEPDGTLDTSFGTGGMATIDIGATDPTTGLPIHTDDFEVAGKLFSMLGGGDVHFLDDKLDFDLRVDPKGPGILLSPVYKLFEYKGEGSLKQPDWHPKRF